MADDTLSDGSSSFNDSSRVIDPRLSTYLAGLSDEFIGRLMNARALIAVGTYGLYQVSSDVQRCFFSVIDDIVEGAILSFEEIVAEHIVEEVSRASKNP